MAVRIAISGFGRIGRNVLRAIAEAGRKDLQVVAVNDLVPADNLAYLLKYDSTQGKFSGTVSSAKSSSAVAEDALKGDRWPCDSRQSGKVGGLDK